MGHNIDDLRKHLFETIEALKAKDKPMEVERAKAISDVAQTIINSAKVEVEVMRLRDGSGTGFVPEREVTQIPGMPRLVAGKSQSGSR